MSFTIRDLRDAIDALKGARGKSMHTLYALLLNNESVALPGVGHALFVEEQEEKRDYWNEGDLYFVFQVGERFFKIDGHYSSYDGASYEGRITEVKQGKIVRYNWESK